MRPLLQKLTWYLVRPRYYTTLIQKTLSKLDDTRRASDECLRWYEEQAIEAPEALSRITHKPYTPIFSQRHKSLIAEAQKRVDDCQVHMGGAGNLELLYQLAEHLRARTVLETGVAYGWSSLAILASLTRRGGHLLSTDLPYPEEGADKAVGCAVPNTFRTHWILKRGSDRQLLKKLSRGTKLDLVHYDSDKSYRGRMWAYPILWKALRPGGIFLSDDIEDNNAFKDFCAQIKRKPIIIQFEQTDSTKYIGCVIK